MEKCPICRKWRHESEFLTRYCGWCEKMRAEVEADALS